MTRDYPEAKAWEALGMIAVGVIAASLTFWVLIMGGLMVMFNGYPAGAFEICLQLFCIALGGLAVFAFSHMVRRRARWWSYVGAMLTTGVVDATWSAYMR